MRAFLGLCLALSFNLAIADEDAWKHLQQGGHVVIMRHALTDPPRGEEPAGFTLADCATQRNLGPRGRADMARLAGALARRGVPVGEVHSSRYCRCQESAMIAFGKAEPWDVLNGYPGPAPYWEGYEFSQMLEIRRRLSEPPPPGSNRFIMTHNTHIKALLDIWVEPGEMVVVRPLGRMFLTVVGRITRDGY
ncbi:MAG: hypothetical protein JNM82_05820 [Rhodocyclaceae bacterium]|nr:hypothetical protein [Rhodocyclaceae bacterium]